MDFLARCGRIVALVASNRIQSVEMAAPDVDMNNGATCLPDGELIECGARVSRCGLYTRRDYRFEHYVDSDESMTGRRSALGL